MSDPASYIDLDGRRRNTTLVEAILAKAHAPGLSPVAVALLRRMAEPAGAPHRVRHHEATFRSLEERGLAKTFWERDEQMGDLTAHGRKVAGILRRTLGALPPPFGADS